MKELIYKNIFGELIVKFITFRITNLANQWSKEVQLEPCTGVELDLTLDTVAVRQALHDLHFIELKG